MHRSISSPFSVAVVFSLVTNLSAFADSHIVTPATLRPASQTQKLAAVSKLETSKQSLIAAPQAKSSDKDRALLKKEADVKIRESSELEKAQGGIGTGGGDVESSRIQSILDLIGRDGSLLRGILTDFAIKAAQLDDAMLDTTGRRLRNLIRNGMLEDIKLAPYEIKAKCMGTFSANQKPELRSASTEMVDMYQRPDQQRPSICINVKRMASINATLDEIVGLMIHEHARHFNQNDTDELEMHPFEEWTTRNLELVSNIDILKLVKVGENFVSLFGSPFDYAYKVDKLRESELANLKLTKRKLNSKGLLGILFQGWDDKAKGNGIYLANPENKIKEVGVTITSANSSCGSSFVTIKTRETMQPDYLWHNANYKPELVALSVDAPKQPLQIGQTYTFTAHQRLEILSPDINAKQQWQKNKDGSNLVVRDDGVCEMSLALTIDGETTQILKNLKPDPVYDRNISVSVESWDKLTPDLKKIRKYDAYGNLLTIK